VSDDRWKLFFDRLKTSAEAADKAWALNPRDPKIPTFMIRLAQSQQKERPEMERWFQRAMELNTNNYTACLNKLWYLNPKWGGTREDMVAFGRECVASTNWGGRVPLILVDAHFEFAKLLSPGEQAPYWRKPDVWPDLKAAYEKFFALNPEAFGFRYYYAGYAYSCGQGREFTNQVRLLRESTAGFSPDYFGGAQAFEQMTREAARQ
jgi:hypothetical protein